MTFNKNVTITDILSFSQARVMEQNYDASTSMRPPSTARTSEKTRAMTAGEADTITTLDILSSATSIPSTYSKCSWTRVDNTPICMVGYRSRVPSVITQFIVACWCELSFIIHTSQFFLGKFIPAIFSLNPNYANLEANFPDVSSQNGR